MFALEFGGVSCWNEVLESDGDGDGDGDGDDDDDDDDGVMMERSSKEEDDPSEVGIGR